MESSVSIFTFVLLWAAALIVLGFIFIKNEFKAQVSEPHPPLAPVDGKLREVSHKHSAQDDDFHKKAS